ncbi:DUF1566 domain-containing protein [Ralstonia pseudosolanacearum]|uniref:DUF1566 domain-containing protein n=1 Tax=Ralstonia pseudosolanacearum TaxID=1310165 RepID=UPI003EE17F14
MSSISLEHIKSEHARVGAEHARVGALIEQYEKQASTTEYVIERAVIPLPAGARVAGPIFKEDGMLDYYLILHADEGRGSHGEAKAYAAGRGLKLPNCREGRLLQAAFPEECAKGNMWLEEDYEGDPACAWYQNFDDGYQDSNHKSVALRAVSVSRFIPSVI